MHLPFTSQAKQGEVIGLALAGQSNRGIARLTGLKRETVARILSQDEYSALIQKYRSQIIEQMLPKALKGLDKILSRKKPDRQAIIDLLYGCKVLSAHHEVEVPRTFERDYSDAMVRYYYEYGRWPTKAEAIEFDKTIPVELLKKGE